MLFFSHLGFACPERKGIADFLQEVTSRKDQAQYRCGPLVVLRSMVDYDLQMMIGDVFRGDFQGDSLRLMRCPCLPWFFPT